MIKTILIDPALYPKEAVINTAYHFLDRAYIFLDRGPKGRGIKVVFEPKGDRKAGRKRLERLAGEFRNSLLHFTLRHQVSRQNKKIREYIVRTALYSSVAGSGVAGARQEGAADYREDPLKIAVPWEKKHGRRRKK